MNEQQKEILEEWRRLAARMGKLPDSAQAAIAVGSAQRLMDKYVASSKETANSFVLVWAPTLELIWTALSQPSVGVDDEIRSRLEEYYSGPYCHFLGDEALPGADEHPAAAAICATEAYSRRDGKSARSAALRLLEAADEKARDLAAENGEDLMSPQAEATMALFAQEEITLLGSAVALVEREGVTDNSLHALRAIFAVY